MAEQNTSWLSDWGQTATTNQIMTACLFACLTDWMNTERNINDLFWLTDCLTLFTEYLAFSQKLFQVISLHYPVIDDIVWYKLFNCIFRYLLRWQGKISIQYAKYKITMICKNKLVELPPFPFFRYLTNKMVLYEFFTAFSTSASPKILRCFLTCLSLAIVAWISRYLFNMSRYDLLPWKWMTYI